MHNGTHKQRFPDLNYYSDTEPWRETRRLAHEVVRTIGHQHPTAPDAPERAEAHWTHDDTLIELLEFHDATHAHYVLSTFPVESSTDVAMRYRFSSVSPRIKHAMRGDDLEFISEDQRLYHQTVINQLLGSGLSHLDSRGIAAIASQMHTDSVFWEQATHATLFTALPHRKSHNNEVGEVSYHTSVIPALGQLAYAIANGDQPLRSQIEQLAQDITTGYAHALSPALSDLPPLTVRDTRTVRRVIEAYLLDIQTQAHSTIQPQHPPTAE